MSRERATTDANGQALPLLPPDRDARVYARLARIMVYVPGFLALLLIRVGEPTAFGLSVELLMLGSASAVVGGLFFGTQSESSGADAAAAVSVWSGALVLELLCAVPILCATPTLFHEIATSSALHSRQQVPVDISLGASAIMPAMAIVPFLVYQLAGFGTLTYVLPKAANWVVNIGIALLVYGSYVSNRSADYVAERRLGLLLATAMTLLVAYGILRLRPRKHEPLAEKS